MSRKRPWGLAALLCYALMFLMLASLNQKPPSKAAPESMQAASAPTPGPLTAATLRGAGAPPPTTPTPPPAVSTPPVRDEAAAARPEDARLIVRVRVLDDERQPVEGAVVRGIDRDDVSRWYPEYTATVPEPWSTSMGYAETDAAGYAELRVMPREAFGGIKAYPPKNREGLKHTVVPVPPRREVRDMEAILRPPVSMRLRTLDPDGEPSPHRWVDVRQLGSDYNSYQSDSEGWLTVPNLAEGIPVQFAPHFDARRQRVEPEKMRVLPHESNLTVRMLTHHRVAVRVHPDDVRPSGVIPLTVLVNGTSLGHVVELPLDGTVVRLPEADPGAKISLETYVGESSLYVAAQDLQAQAAPHLLRPIEGVPLHLTIVSVDMEKLQANRVELAHSDGGQLRYGSSLEPLVVGRAVTFQGLARRQYTIIVRGERNREVLWGRAVVTPPESATITLQTARVLRISARCAEAVRSAHVSTSLHISPRWTEWLPKLSRDWPLAYQTEAAPPWACHVVAKGMGYLADSDGSPVPVEGSTLVPLGVEEVEVVVRPKR